MVTRTHSATAHDRARTDPPTPCLVSPRTTHPLPRRHTYHRRSVVSAACRTPSAQCSCGWRPEGLPPSAVLAAAAAPDHPALSRDRARAAPSVGMRGAGDVGSARSWPTHRTRQDVRGDTHRRAGLCAGTAAAPTPVTRQEVHSTEPGRACVAVGRPGCTRIRSARRPDDRPSRAHCTPRAMFRSAAFDTDAGALPVPRARHVPTSARDRSSTDGPTSSALTDRCARTESVRMVWRRLLLLLATDIAHTHTHPCTLHTHRHTHHPEHARQPRRQRPAPCAASPRHGTGGARSDRAGLACHSRTVPVPPATQPAKSRMRSTTRLGVPHGTRTRADAF